MAVLETMGYECYTEDEDIALKRNGDVIDKVKVALVESKCREDERDKKRIAQLGAILKKYRDMSANRQELQEIMKSKFGVGLVFLGSKDSPYGYMIVDHHTKAVFKGSNVVKIKELLQFQSAEDRFRQMDAFIDQMLDDNINLTTKDINRLLRRQFGTRLLDGAIQYGGSTFRLPDHILTVLRSNDRRAWLQSFCPMSEQERDILCTIGNYNHPERISIQKDTGTNVQKTVEQLRSIFDSTPDRSLHLKLREDGYVITRAEGRFYCIDFANHSIVNMNAHGFDVSRLNPLPNWKPEDVQTLQIKRQRASDVGRAVSDVANQRGGSQDSNREWEVGGQGNDDGRRLKR